MNRIRLERSFDATLLRDIDNGFTAFGMYYARNMEYLPCKVLEDLPGFFQMYGAMVSVFRAQHEMLCAKGDKEVTHDDN